VPRRILLDTDIGSDVDDALALGLALASPELELVAVTTVAGDVDARARIAARLLGLAGRRDVEVCAGERAPVLRGADRFGWFGHEGAALADGPDAPVSREPAAARIARAAREIDGLELVAVGPLSNLARALALDPELPRRVAGLWVMGGHLREVRIGAHVCAPGVDYNLCSDPEAAVAVLGAGFRTTLVTADVTLRTWLRRAQLEELARAGPLARALAALVRVWEPVQRRIFTDMGGDVAEDNVAFLHDPLTVLACVAPAPLRFETLRVATAVENGVLRTHELPPALGRGSELCAATDVDAPAAERAIAERLLRL
jgi:purine nucleosidase